MLPYGEVLRALGVDRKTAEESFAGNLALYVKYLRAFAQDPSYEELRQAVARGDGQAAAAAAHTLKGISATLLLEAVLAPCLEILSLARAGRMDEAEKVMPKLRQAYESVLRIIEKYA